MHASRIVDADLRQTEEVEIDRESWKTIMKKSCAGRGEDVGCLGGFIVRRNKDAFVNGGCLGKHASEREPIWGLFAE